MIYGFITFSVEFHLINFTFLIPTHPFRNWRTWNYGRKHRDLCDKPSLLAHPTWMIFNIDLYTISIEFHLINLINFTFLIIYRPFAFLILGFFFPLHNEFSSDNFLFLFSFLILGFFFFFLYTMSFLSYNFYFFLHHLFRRLTFFSNILIF